MSIDKINYIENRNHCNIDRPTLFYRCGNDADWSTHYISDDCERIMNVQAAYLIANNTVFSKMLLPNEKDHIHNVVQQALINRAPFQLTYHILTSENKQKLLFEQGQGVYNSDGHVTELTGFITDLTPSDNPLICHYNNEFVNQCLNEVAQIAYEKRLIYSKKVNFGKREIEVAIYACQGLSMKEIGLELEISNRTAESYLYSIKRKLGCHSKSQLKNLFLSSHSARHLLLASCHLL